MKNSKRVLVVYYSLSGNTERVALELATRLDADVERIREPVRRAGLLGYLRAALDSLRERPALLCEVERHADDYELVIVGTPIWAGKITPAVRTYLRSIRGQARRVAFFITSGATNIDRVLPSMEDQVRAHAAAAAGFTEHELRDQRKFDRNLATFLSALRAAPARTVAAVPEHPYTLVGDRP